MTVKELIEKLKGFDQSKEVWSTVEFMHCCHGDIDIDFKVGKVYIDHEGDVVLSES